MQPPAGHRYGARRLSGRYRRAHSRATALTATNVGRDWRGVVSCFAGRRGRFSHGRAPLPLVTRPSTPRAVKQRKSSETYSGSWPEVSSSLSRDSLETLHAVRRASCHTCHATLVLASGSDGGRRAGDTAIEDEVLWLMGVGRERRRGRSNDSVAGGGAIVRDGCESDGHPLPGRFRGSSAAASCTRASLQRARPPCTCDAQQRG